MVDQMEAQVKLGAADQSHRSIDPLRAVRDHALPAGADRYLARYQAACRSKSAVYISTPITTGPKFVSWRRRVGAQLTPSEVQYATELRAHVIHENLRAVVPLKQKVHKAFPDAVIIDPTELDVSGWQQFDYHRFWVEVIDKFVSRMVFADGWSLSTGCTVEYLAARADDLPCFTADLERLTAEHAYGLLVSSSDQLQEARLDASVATGALASLSL